MNLTGQFKITVVLAVAGVLACQARAQTEIYQLSTPINGQLEGSLTDWGNNPGPRPNVLFNGDWTFSSLTETIYLNPTTLTLRQVGFVSVQNPTLTGMFSESHSVSGHGVSGNLTVTQTLPNGGFSFDTGPQPIVWNASTHQYQLDSDNGGNASLGNISIAGSYSLTTGNHTFTGNLNYAIGPNSYPPPNAFTTFTPIGNGSSLAVDGFSGGNANFSLGPVVLADQTDQNGFQMQLQAGQDDHLDFFNWSSNPSTATLTPTPEPSTYALLGMGLIGMLCLGRKRLRSK